MKKKSKKIDKATLWRALRREISDQEINDIAFSDADYEMDDYYDYELLYTEFVAYFKNNSSYSELMSWLIFVETCLSSSNIADKKIAHEYSGICREITEYSLVFVDPFEYDYVSKKQERINCRKLFAQLKWHNHNIENIRQGKMTDFTTNGVITYVSFAFSLRNGKTHIDSVCVVDKENRHINFIYIENIDYREDINYTLLSEAEFNDLPSRYVKGYKLDSSMGADYAVTK